MRFEYLHASKYGNGAMVAEEFDKQLAAKGVTVNVHHIREARPDRLPAADLYLFSSPGRMGKPGVVRTKTYIIPKIIKTHFDFLDLNTRLSADGVTETSQPSSD